MILIDYSQTAIANIIQQVGFNQQVKMDEGMCRHMILNSIRHKYVRFRREFGTDMVIACDAGNIWRKDEFPFYKIRRAKDRDNDSTIDWKLLYETLEKVKAELKEFFPYPVVQVDKAEADDVIGTLCHMKGAILGGDPILIVSKDKDFAQLQKYSNVKQYNSTADKFIEIPNPENILKELIIKGDDGDDIPNILSDDNCFAMKIRQKPMTAKRLQEHMDIEPQFYDQKVKLNWDRNKKLIDLEEIPKTIQEQIISEYKSQQGKSRGKLMNYFVEHNLNNLLEAIGDF